MMKVYSKSKVGIAVPQTPNLSLAMIASPLLNVGHDVRILDLSMSTKPRKDLIRELETFSPHYVGVTFTTPLFYQMVEISRIVKNYDKNIIVVGGGPHASVLPTQTIKDSKLDIAVIGEGEYTFLDIVSGKPLKSINGICFRRKEIVLNPRKDLIKNLDSLPFPAWHLYEIKKYKFPRLTCKRNPVGQIETSRGCPFGCTYCSKSVFGRTFRAKSAERVVDEIECMLNMGFREIHIVDDVFSTDMKRAKAICDGIKRKGLEFPWNLRVGIRVDRVDTELFVKMREAGCYRASFGVESGDQNILNKINKGITLDQVRLAFRLAREVGIETLAFFMIGLPCDTEETIRKTIDFAKELEPDIVKVSITIPFPGTSLFYELEKNGFIKTKDWSKYYFHSPDGVYDHPNLSWETIYRYYKLFYRELYLNPKFILRKIAKDLRNRELLYDIHYFLKTLRYGW